MSGQHGTNGTNPSSHLPLEPIELPVLPLNTHNIAWSPDLELAVGADDSVFIFLPQFPAPSQGTATASARASHQGPTRQYDEVALRFPATEARSPQLNKHLFEAVGHDFPHGDDGNDDSPDPTLRAGQGPIARTGGSLNHVVALAWSPCGLARMKRSVLAVLNGSGTITIYCESSLPGNAPGVAVHGRKARTLRPLVVPWSVGNGRYVPVTAAGHQESDEEDSLYNPEYITSMAWAHQLGAPGDGSLLAYMNDIDEIVLLAVQAQHGTTNSGHGISGKWRVEEVARFFAGGPHPATDPSDPDFVPSGTPFALSWSPWASFNGYKTSLLSYISRNYVGFRRVTIQDNWLPMETPAIEVSGSDSEGICLHLSSDAFVTWEDTVWSKDDSHILRGIIATPYRVQAFQMPLDLSTAKNSMASHATDDCGTTYPRPGENHSLNPITGLVIHRSPALERGASPLFSLVRLSATHLNDDWYQTNVPITPEGKNWPGWSTEIRQTIEHNLPRSLAYRPRKSLAVDDSEPEEDSEDDEEDWADGYEEDLMRESFPVRQVDDSTRPVFTTRMRIWGLQVSPGGGSMAVFATEHDTIKPERSSFAGLRCKILFGRSASLGEDAQSAYIATGPSLSTEAQAWDWLYGHGRAPPGVDDAIYDFGSDLLKAHFAEISSSQACSFCNMSVTSNGGYYQCNNGHSFETCGATGMPILEPGISNTCGVCSSKCLRADILDKTLHDHPRRQEILHLISPTFCGRCGGKFND